MKTEEKSMKKVSFVIPCYKSALTLPTVVTEINDAMSEMPEYSHEIILVNDCSPDHTFAVITQLAQTYDNITGINLARNFGQHSALMAGISHATGDIIVCLDDDGQTPANQVGRLLQAIEEGHDAVYARYKHKKHNLFRNFGSRMNDYMLRTMLNKPKDLYVSSYFAVKRFVADSMKEYSNAYPYVIGLVLRATKDIVNVDVDHREREVGRSGYNFRKLVALWMNGFTAFSIKPLRIATFVGSVCAFIGFLYMLYVIIRHFVVNTAPLGYSSLISVILFIGGMLMLMLGMVGEYVGRIYICINNSPQFVISEIVTKNEEENK